MGAWLAKLDKWTDPVLDTSTASTLGGILTILMATLTAIYAGYQVAAIESVETAVEVSSFPTQSSEAFVLPKMLCIAPSGCWVRPMQVTTPAAARRSPSTASQPSGSNNNQPSGSNNNQPSGSNNDQPSGANEAPKCYYFAENEEISQDILQFYYLTDPIDALSVTWASGVCNANAGSTAAQASVNFGVSYQFTSVTDQYSGETDTVEPGGYSATSTKSYKLFRGSNLMSLVQTLGWGVDAYDVKSFSAVVMSTDGTPDAQQNMCCVNPTVIATSGTITNTLSNQCSETCNGSSLKYYQTRIAANPTYMKVSVVNPWIGWFEKIGGIVAVIDLIFVIFLWMAKETHSRCCASDSKSSQDAVGCELQPGVQPAPVMEDRTIVVDVDKAL